MPQFTRHLAACSATVACALLLLAGCGKVEPAGTQLEVTMLSDADPADRAIQQMELRQVLDLRLRAFGIQFHEVNPNGDGKLLVKLPGLFMANPQEAGIVQGLKTQMLRRGELRFAFIHADSAALLAADPVEIPEGYSRYDIPAGPDSEARSYLIADAPAAPISLGNMKRSEVFSQTNNAFKVTMEFDEAGSAALTSLTSENAGREVAIVLDGQILRVLKISAAITNGQAELSNLPSQLEATRLAIIFSSGTLPVPITIGEPGGYGEQPTPGAN